VSNASSKKPMDYLAMGWDLFVNGKLPAGLDDDDQAAAAATSSAATPATSGPCSSSCTRCAGSGKVVVVASGQDVIAACPNGKGR
jgi:hypothetical protein